jgi:hypothetical protein
MLRKGFMEEEGREYIFLIRRTHSNSLSFFPIQVADILFFNSKSWTILDPSYKWNHVLFVTDLFYLVWTRFTAIIVAIIKK